MEASLLARVGFHLDVSAYWVSMPTVADIVIVIGTSDDKIVDEKGSVVGRRPSLPGGSANRRTCWHQIQIAQEVCRCKLVGLSPTNEERAY